MWVLTFHVRFSLDIAGLSKAMTIARKELKSLKCKHLQKKMDAVSLAIIITNNGPAKADQMKIHTGVCM